MFSVRRNCLMMTYGWSRLICCCYYTVVIVRKKLLHHMMNAACTSFSLSACTLRLASMMPWPTFPTRRNCLELCGLLAREITCNKRHHIIATNGGNNRKKLWAQRDRNNTVAMMVMCERKQKQKQISFHFFVRRTSCCDIIIIIVLGVGNWCSSGRSRYRRCVNVRLTKLMGCVLCVAMPK